MSWKETLAAVAPTLATALGGPLAGMAAKVAADALGVEPAKLESTIATSDPEVMLKLKTAEQTFALEMEKLGIERERLTVKSQDSARGLAKVNMTPHIVLTALYTVGYFSLIGVLISGVAKVPPGDAGHLMSGLIGVLTTVQIKVADFWFGSSHGSKQKNS